jgi:hypothetical protein
MSFAHITEPYVDGTVVREFLGGVTHVTLWRWCQEGLPYHLGRNGRRMYRLSEVEAWFFADQDDARFKRTDSAPGESVA